MGKETVRLSLKTIAHMFPPGSIERVLLHGRWQKTRGRGRKPTLLFGNHTDPRCALAAVEELAGTYFDELFRQYNSRQKPFWHDAMIQAVQDRTPVYELPPLDVPM